MKTEKIFDVEGMTCASCSMAITKTLEKKDGVTSVNVNLATNRATVVFDMDKVGTETITGWIDALGYKAVLPTMDKTLKFNVQGMTCASCALALEKTVSKLDGVKKVTINLATDTMDVIYDMKTVSVEAIKNATKTIGYPSSVSHQDARETSNETETLKTATRKMTMSAIFAGTIMVLMVIHMFLWNIPLYTVITGVLAAPVVLWFGRDVHVHAFKSLKAKVPNMDVLVSLGSLPPFLIGWLALWFPMTTFIEMSATIMTFHLIGKYLETKAKGKASDAIRKLTALEAKTAHLEKDGIITNVPVQTLDVGDVVIIKPGEKIPADGVIILGSASIDESISTGESMPVFKTEGDEVIGATINTDGSLKVRILHVREDTFLAHVIRLVEACQGSKVPVQAFADKVTGIFVPAIMVLTGLTFLSFLLFNDFHVRILSWMAQFLPWINPDLDPLALAFVTATAVLVIACPCALGLGTPTALMVGSGIGAEHGILIRNGEAVQMAKDIKVIAFDKTGTLTEGKPKMTDIIAFDDDEKRLLAYAEALERHSGHPIAKAILDEAERISVTKLEATDFLDLPGKGIKASIDSSEFLLGNARLMDEYEVKIDHQMEAIKAMQNDAKTVIMIAMDKKLIGLMALRDTIKNGAADAISALEAMGIETIMITGDNDETARAIAREAGISSVISNVLPEGKKDVIDQLKAEKGIVGMVGDGINDAPALTSADVGFALGSGTDIAIDSADITLVSTNPMALVVAIRLSKATFRKIKENFFWAWIYNAIAIPFAMMGLLHPMIGAAAMSLSSLNVIYNSLRLRKQHFSIGKETSHA
ncbi:MAG: heavy metal translocating P-type ATPase [Acholeplasmataceae bacterium]|nr:heavy metal translocating P-type ATPase [Acholeplasmataceae bacterium]